MTSSILPSTFILNSHDPLKENNKLQPYVPDKNVNFDIFTGKKYFVLSKDSSICISDTFDENEAEKVSLYCLEKLTQMRRNQPISQKEKEAFALFCSLHLQAMTKRYHREIDPGQKGYRINRFTWLVVKLDRHLAAWKFSAIQDKKKPLTLEQAQTFFCTKVSKMMIEDFFGYKTHSGLKNHSDSPEDKLFRSEIFCNAFILNPEEVDYMQDGFLHSGRLYQKVARYNHHIEIDPQTLHFKMRYYNFMHPVEFIMNDTSGCCIQYESERGVIKVDQNEGINQLVPFKKRKPLKSDDNYRVVVKSLITNKYKHCWLELKDPHQRYTIGFGYPRHLPISSWLISLSYPAEFASPDRFEFLGLCDRITKTTIAISQKEFETLKSHIEFEMQQTPKLFYNWINRNCTSFVRRSLEKINISLPSEDSGLGLLLGYRKRANQPLFFVVHMFYLLFYKLFVVAIRNPVLYVLGGGYVYVDGKLKKSPNALFPSFWHIFNPSIGDNDYPNRARHWQMLVEKQRKNAVERLKKTAAYQRLDENQRQGEIRKILTSKPTIDVAV